PRAAKGRSWMQLHVRDRSNTPDVFVAIVLGRVFSNLPVDSPFEAVDAILGALPQLNPIAIIEVHAEATSEKLALGHYLDGRVAAVFGTHTHVPTADAQIFARGTAYITDLGMCGPYDSIIGRRIDRVLKHMTTGMPAPFDVAVGDPRVCGAFIEIDTDRRVATAIERIELRADPHSPPFSAS
ncbi:MAG: YmdB family metallophosphoesterase, partial [Pirellulaceae bacterium]|nr:YmdB family metallophosphoesterase [Pirellulaceae bacterium]